MSSNGSHGTKERILYVNFNQDYSCISVGTDEGFKIFTCDPFRKCYEKKSGGMCHVSMLYSTSLLALVGAGQQATLSPRRLQLYNSSETKVICELNFVSSILNVFLSKKRLVVVLEKKIHIFDISTMKILITIDTEPNPRGICALSMGSEQSYIAYPYGADMNDVMLFDVFNPHPINVIRASKGTISALSFNSDGTMLATASNKGTVIRVFSIPDTTLLYTLRRGTYPASIYCISFNISSTMLCVSSDKGTVHVFKLPAPGQQGKKGQKQRNVGTLSDTISNMWDTQRDFAHVKVRGEAGVRNVCAISSDNSRLMVATADGYFYQYHIDHNGGESRLEREDVLFDINDQHVNSKVIQDDSSNSNNNNGTTTTTTTTDNSTDNNNNNTMSQFNDSDSDDDLNSGNGRPTTN